MARQMMCAVVGVLLLSPCHTRADRASHRQAAQELLAVMKAEANLRKTLEMQLVAAGGTSEMTEAAKRFYAQYLKWEEAEPDVVTVYMAAFSEAEILELTAFYKTPIGRKVRDAQPEIGGKMLEIVMAHTKEHVHEYQRMLTGADIEDTPDSKSGPEQTEPDTPLEPRGDGAEKTGTPHANVTAPAEMVAIEGTPAELNAFFVIAFQNADMPEDSREEDIRTAIIEIMVHRLQALGIDDPDIETLGKTSISLGLSTMSLFDAEDVAQLLGHRGELQFRLVSPENAEHVKNLRANPVSFDSPQGYDKYEMMVKRDGLFEKEVLFVSSTPEELNERDIDRASVTRDAVGNYPISLVFSDEGAKVFGKITADNVDRRLAMLIDGKVHSAPVIKEAIVGGSAQITGTFSAKGATLLAAAIDSGAYPVPVLVEVRE